MKQITFEDIYTLGNIEADNERFRHVHYPEMLIRYDSNFLEFKTMPSLQEFKEAEKYLRDYHLQRGQQHVKFCYPANMKPTDDLDVYLAEAGYETGFLELYAVQPQQFPSLAANPEIEIQVVTEASMEELLALRYKSDLEFGKDFAEQRAELVKRQFKDPDITQLIAFYQGKPAGFSDIIVSAETAEIDDLSVSEQYRNKGIASRLQKFVMDSFPDKTVILVADGEDTPREMYQKQNYMCQGFKYETIKVYER